MVEAEVRPFLKQNLLYEVYHFFNPGNYVQTALKKILTYKNTCLSTFKDFYLEKLKDDTICLSLSYNGDGEYLQYLIECLENASLPNIRKLILDLSYVAVNNQDAEMFSSILSLTSINYIKVVLRKLSSNQKSLIDIISQLNRIETLNTIDFDFSKSSIHPDQLSSIFEKLAGCKMIQKFDLDLSENNHIAVPIIPSLIESIKNWENLEHFSLNLKRSINGEIDRIAELINCFPILRTLKLDISYNNKVNNIPSLSKALNVLQKLTRLELSLIETKLSFHEFALLLDDLKNLSDLKILSLNLGHNQIGKEVIETKKINLEGSFPKLRSLILYLNSNFFVETSLHITLKNIFSGLSHLSYLQLSISNNAIGVNCIEIVMKHVNVLKDLTDLKLTLNETKIDDTCQHFESLVKLKSLQCINLYLVRCNLTSKSIIHIKDALLNYPKLKELNLVLTDNKQIGPEGSKIISDLINNLKFVSVLRLSLSECNLGNEGARYLCEVLKDHVEYESVSVALFYNGIGNEIKEMLRNKLKSHINL